jgi:16S rRNA G966 N2-methylase RsmD
MLKENIRKTRMEEKSTIFNQDYKKCLSGLEEQFDIIFIDPPYKQNIAIDAIKRILDFKLLARDGIIILETDEEERELKELEEVEIEVYDKRKYGRIRLLFLR